MTDWSKFAYDVNSIRQALARCTNPIIVGHIAPDGDAVGSALALYLTFKQQGKQAKVVFQDDIPDNLSFLPAAGKILKPVQIEDKPDLVFMVDCATQERTGNGWIDQYCQNNVVIAVDHHLVGEKPNGICIVDDDAAATAELIYRLLKDLDVDITKAIAACLYAGIASDTGGFIYNNTTKESFMIAGELLEIGVDMEAMRINLFENRSMPGIAVLGYALMNMEQSKDKRLTWTSLPGKIKNMAGAQSKDCDNIASYTMFPSGAKVGIFFEEDSQEGKVKISLRSRNGYDVSALAAKFGGGGHTMAAGCRMKGDLALVTPKVLAAAQEMLKKIK